MKQSNNKISAEVKAQVMLELSKPESGVRNISRQYGVSRATIYSWLRAESAMAGCVVSSAACVDERAGFMELAVIEDGDHSSLTKASLVFEDFSLSLEGKLSSGKLISIIKILEASC